MVGRLRFSAVRSIASDGINLSALDALQALVGMAFAWEWSRVRFGAFHLSNLLIQ